MAQWLSWLERRPVTAEVVGSSPIWVVSLKCEKDGVLAQLGEHLPYKQRVIGSSPIGPILRYYMAAAKSADVAQLAEQLICNQQVIGSSPIIGLDMKMSIKYGQIPEWPKGTDCKSAGNAFGGSNPPLPISIFHENVHIIIL